MSGDHEFAYFLNGHSSDDGLVKLAIEDVQKSGLSPETLERAQVRIFNGDTDTLKDRLGFASINGQSILSLSKLIEFPYFNKDGNILFYRYKLIPPTINKDGREIKYLHPKGKPAIPYILPEVWKIKDKTNKPIWVVEGEKKCVKLVQHSRYAIALPGVWNFKAGANSDLKDDKELWTELQSFDWKDKTVFLSFDMDLWTNAKVRLALYTLAFRLQKMGAFVKIPTWTPGKGIDDHLVNQNEPDTNGFSLDPEEVLSFIEVKAQKLFDFIDSDHIGEIIPAVKAMMGEDGIKNDMLLKVLSKKLKVSVKVLREELKKAKPKEAPHIFPTIEPWPDPVEGAELLDQLTNIYKKYVVLPDYGADVLALWSVFTYTIDAAVTSPILGLESPVPRCGKTTLMSILSEITSRAIAASNISPPALFRCIEKWRPTLLIDEADSFLKENEELRGILNSGHTRSTAYVIRCQGDEHEPTRFNTWGAKAIALIGKLPGTLEDRSIVIPMRRKRKDEQVAKFRHSRDEAGFSDIRRKSFRFTNDNIETLRKADPFIPAELHDRASDNWVPLLTIADLVGGEWPKRARRAAVALSDCISEDDSASMMLLTDIKIYFTEYNTDKVASADLCDYLVKMEDRPWPEWYKGKPMSTRQLARLLNPFGIIPGTIRIGIETQKGYRKDAFIDAFSRYIPNTPNSSVTPSQANNDATKREFSSVTQSEMLRMKKAVSPNEMAGCDGVTDKRGDMSKNNSIFTVRETEPPILDLE